MTETERVVKIYAKYMLKVCEILGIIGNDSLLRTYKLFLLKEIKFDCTVILR